MPQPILHTARLCLRPFHPADAPRVHQLVSLREIAEGCVLIPHPYPAGLAARWIASHEGWWQQQQAVIYAICLSDQQTVIGSLNLMLREVRQDNGTVQMVGDLGYWLAPEEWGRGYMSEAVAALLDLAFYELGVDQVEAQHLRENPASGRIMLKNGLQPITERISYEPDQRPHHLICYNLSWSGYQQWRARRAITSGNASPRQQDLPGCQ